MANLSLSVQVRPNENSGEALMKISRGWRCYIPAILLLAFLPAFVLGQDSSSQSLGDVARKLRKDETNEVRMTDAEAKAPGLFLAGHYRDGVSLSDSIVSGCNVADRIEKYLLA